MIMMSVWHLGSSVWFIAANNICLAARTHSLPKPSNSFLHSCAKGGVAALHEVILVVHQDMVAIHLQDQESTSAENNFYLSRAAC